MKKFLKSALVVVIAGIIFCTVYVGFNQKGLETWLVGQTEGDHYPDWEKTVALYKLDYSILNKDNLFFSNVYLLKGAEGCYQLRFRFAYSIPFMHGDLLEDTDWVKLADSDGNDYSDCLTVYSSGIAGLNCINATLVMDADTFSALVGDKLTVSVVCTKTGQNEKNSYAGGEVEITVPEM